MRFFEPIYLEADVNGYDGMSKRWSEPVMLLSGATEGRLERSREEHYRSSRVGLRNPRRVYGRQGALGRGPADQRERRSRLRRPRGEVGALHPPARGRWA